MKHTGPELNRAVPRMRTLGGKLGGQRERDGVRCTPYPLLCPESREKGSAWPVPRFLGAYIGREGCSYPPVTWFRSWRGKKRGRRWFAHHR